MKKICPKCGHDVFYTTAQVTQEWLVDARGDLLETVSDCVEVIIPPEDCGIYVCAKCHTEAVNDERLSMEELAEVLNSYARMIHRDNGKHPAVVFDDLEASIRSVKKRGFYF